VVLGRAEVGLSHANLAEAQAALQGAPQAVLRRRGDYAPRYALEVLSRAADIRVHYARPVRVEGRVVGALLLSRSPRSLFRGIYDDLGKIALGVGVIFLIILGVATLLSRAIARPIERLTEATKRVAKGPSDVPAPPATAAVEIRELFENFGQMAGEIERRSNYLRDFAAAMSHEFKTPLAGIRGALELLEEHGADMNEDERRRFLANANADAARLSRLVGRLLELARADVASPEAARHGLAAPVRNVADALSGTRCRVEVWIEGDLKVSSPPEVVEAVLTTLVENAAQAGARCVTIVASQAGGSTVIDVIDDGPGVAAADRRRLFEPFFTTRRQDGGTGLGLAIARSLLRAHDSTIEFVEREAGATFRIRFSG
jgi:two-component system sensor histidine kinase ChvG